MKQTVNKNKPSKPMKQNTKNFQKKREFLSWYEIPATNLDRAIHFYSTIFNLKFEPIQTPTHTMAIFPAETGIGGALVLGDGCIPSQHGPLLYLNAGANLEDSISKVGIAGGQVLMGKTFINEDIGYYSLVLDSEGNRLALYSNI